VTLSILHPSDFHFIKATCIPTFPANKITNMTHFIVGKRVCSIYNNFIDINTEITPFIGFYVQGALAENVGMRVCYNEMRIRQVAY